MLFTAPRHVTREHLRWQVHLQATEASLAPPFPAEAARLLGAPLMETDNPTLLRPFTTALPSSRPA